MLPCLTGMFVDQKIPPLKLETACFFYRWPYQDLSSFLFLIRALSKLCKESEFSRFFKFLILFFPILNVHHLIHNFTSLNGEIRPICCWRMDLQVHSCCHAHAGSHVFKWPKSSRNPSRHSSTFAMICFFPFNHQNS
jgi:hypothetical protein